MAYYLRAPKGSLGHLQWDIPDRPFITAAPLVMHDRCATPEVVANPHHTDQEGFWAHHNARQAFADRCGEGYALCWDFLYSDRPDAPACYFCGEPVIGRG